MKILLVCLVMIGGIFWMGLDASEGVPTETSSIYDFDVETIDGDRISMKKFQGKVLLIVNVASQCGFTSQYEGLEELYDKYKEKGLVVLGFPANNFGNQEPGSNEEIKSFCTTRFGVNFPMMAKVSVKGEESHPLFAYLTSKKMGHPFGGSISWNFTKFLISREGEVIYRYASMTSPKAKRVHQKIEEALAKE